MPWVSRLALKLMTASTEQRAAELRNDVHDLRLDHARLLNTLLAAKEQEMTARAEAAAAKAYADVWRVQVTALVQKEAAYLEKLLPNLGLQVPVIQASPATIPGSTVDFEDMGDAAAAHMGMADLHPVSAIHGVASFRDPDETDHTGD